MEVVFWGVRRYSAEDALELGNQVTDELRQYWHAAADDPAGDFRVTEKKKILTGGLNMVEEKKLRTTRAKLTPSHM